MIRLARPAIVSSAARCLACSADPDFDRTVNAARLSSGSWSQTSPRQYGPHSAMQARTLASPLATRAA